MTVYQTMDTTYDLLCQLWGDGFLVLNSYLAQILHASVDTILEYDRANIFGEEPKNAN